MRSEDITDEDLMRRIDALDLKLFSDGRTIRQRAWEVPTKLSQQLGHDLIFTGRDTNPMYERICALYSRIYGPTIFASGGHIGAFMFRGTYVRIAVPHMFGEQSFDPFDAIELTEIQEMIIKSDISQAEMCVDQVLDVLDIQYGVRSITSPYSENDVTVRFLDRAQTHLHAAAAILTGGYDPRGAVQNALLAVELSLKAAGAGLGLTEAELKDHKRYGHDTAAIADFLKIKVPTFDGDRVRRVIDALPKYVENRYQQTQPSEQEIGHIVMGSQYIVSEVVRILKGHNIREDNGFNGMRRYPS